MVTFNLGTDITDNPKFHLSQNWKNANSMDVELLASFNPFLQQIWSSNNVQETWNLLAEGITDLSNMLGPTKVVQHRSNFQPYLTDELKEMGNQVKLKFSHAVTTGHDYDWDDRNSTKSTNQKALNFGKNQYFASALTGTRQIWNFIKNISGGSKISIPTCIIEGGRSVTSNTMIANLMNSYFIVKIAAIVTSFTPLNYDELIFLKHLIPRPK